MQAQGGAGALIRCPMNLSSFSGTGGPRRLPVPVSPGLSFPIDDISGLGLVPEVVLPAECTVKTLLCQSTVISDRSHEAFTVLKYTSFHQLRVQEAGATCPGHPGTSHTARVCESRRAGSAS